MFKLFVCLLFSLTRSHVNTQTCSFEQDIDYFGNDISSTPIYLTSSDLCCLSCQADTNCQIWTYVSATTACWLKKSVGSVRVVSVGSTLSLNEISYLNIKFVSKNLRSLWGKANFCINYFTNHFIHCCSNNCFIIHSLLLIRTRH